jgi:hypothetical protein
MVREWGNICDLRHRAISNTCRRTYLKRNPVIAERQTNFIWSLRIAHKNRSRTTVPAKLPDLARERLEDGAAVADNGNGFLVSNNDYADFQLRVEFWIEAKTNSGVFIRCTNPNEVTGKTAYEVNIWDTRPEQKYGTGAIVDVAAVDPMPTAGGKWNVYEITAKGDTFTVVLNGQKTVDGAHADKFAKGRIALQHGKGVSDETGIVKFRKVEIKPL